MRGDDRWQRRTPVRRKRTGGSEPQAPALQGLDTQTLWIAPAGFRKLDDFSSDSLTNWIGVVGDGAERRKRHLKGNAHEMDGFPVEAMAVQERPDRHDRSLNCGDPRRSPRSNVPATGKMHLLVSSTS
jgi:hypothetical protein